METEIEKLNVQYWQLYDKRESMKIFNRVCREPSGRFYKWEIDACTKEMRRLSRKMKRIKAA